MHMGVVKGARPRWGRAAAAVAAAGAICMAETGAAAAADHDTVVDCNRDPNALVLALSTAQPGSTLRIKGVCFGNFVINTDLKLVGVDDAVLDGHETGTTVTVNSARVVLKNLTIIHGNAVNGGGVLNNGGRVTLDDSTVRNNTVSQGGGGIDNQNGTLTLTRSTVRNNIANGVFGFGGGINSNKGTVTLDHSTVSNNFAGGTVGSLGGGIENGQTKLKLTNSTVSNNSAVEAGGIDTFNKSTLTLIDSTVSKNSASTLDSGGILVEHTNTSATLYRSQILANTSGSNDGGGIYNQSETTLEETTVSGNIAGRFGGGIFNGPTGNLTLRRSTVEHNTAYQDGGDIYNLGVVTLRDSEVRKNHPDNCAPTPIPGCKS